MFFEFYQNNSGGYLVEDSVATKYVIIEADDYKDANKIADDKGLFSYSWCECCGERFMSAWDDSDGTDKPTIYGKPIEDMVGDTFGVVGEVFARVFYKDGTVEEHKQ